MTYDSWQGAIADIKKRTRPVTDKQKKLAASAGIKLPEKLPQLVAAARLQVALSDELGFSKPEPIHYVQEEIIADLAKQGLKAAPKPQDRREAEAWITHLRLINRLRAHERLRLGAGDIVGVTGSAGSFVATVSSIGDTGRIHFKGGNGGAAWPDQVILKCRRDDDGPKALKLKAQADNIAAHRARVDSWSASKHYELKEFEVTQSLSTENIEQLREVVEGATDERPIQHFIESCPQVLTAILGGNTRFLLSRRPLAGKYVPDFLISDTDSAGIRWLLVELETPNSSVTMSTRNDLDDNARKGVSQIKEWREWLQNNLGMARRSRRDDGLGLIDIRPKSEGLVLIGRRSRLNSNSAAIRNAIREDSAIRVHTYDWLIEQLVGSLKFSGPPALSPFVIQPPREKPPSWMDEAF